MRFSSLCWCFCFVLSVTRLLLVLFSGVVIVILLLKRDFCFENWKGMMFCERLEALDNDCPRNSKNPIPIWFDFYRGIHSPTMWKTTFSMFSTRIGSNFAEKMHLLTKCHQFSELKSIFNEFDARRTLTRNVEMMKRWHFPRKNDFSYENSRLIRRL